MNRNAMILTLLMATMLPAQRPYEAAYPSEVTPSPKLRANRNSYSAIMDVLKPSRPQVTSQQLERLNKLQLENIWSVVGDYKTCFVRGFKATRPGERLVGRAVTIRYLPPRPDLRRAQESLAREGDWSLGYHVRAAEEVKPGDVLVVDAGGERGTVFFGDMSALGIKLRGAAGVIIDGGSRDLAGLQSDQFRGFPVFARFFDVSGATWWGTEWNVPVRIENVTILPGDVVVAEEEGVLFFPPDILDDVIQKASAREAMEDFERSLVLQKKYLFRDVYPPAPKLREEFEKKSRSETELY